MSEVPEFKWHQIPEKPKDFKTLNTSQKNAVIRANFTKKEFDEYCKERPDRDFGEY